MADVRDDRSGIRARLAGAAALVTALAVVTACTGGGAAAPSGSPAVEAASRVATSLSSRGFASLGQLLVDDQGRTLYVNHDEAHDPTACDATCIAAWPLVLASAVGAEPAASDGVLARLVGTATVAGRPVVTYAGYPLHVYVGDSGPGDDNGEGAEHLWSGITVAGTPATTPQ